ncbi:MAG: N-acetylmuramoyl-L-alanine amidase [Myxococcota bacterium]
MGGMLAVTLIALPLVVIDPGHGGPHDGARGICGVLEKDVVLEIGRELAQILEASGQARTLLTRGDDRNVELEARAEIANRREAAVFVSIHANASSSRKHAGVETFFLSNESTEERHQALVTRENEGRSLGASKKSSPLDALLGRLAHEASHQESQRLAIRLHDELARHTPYRARGVMQAPFIVLKGAAMAAALVEVGFLTHVDQCQKLARRRYQRRVATHLAGGIIAHLKAEAAAHGSAALTR